MPEELPAPPTPRDANLRDFPYIPLDCVRLRDSEVAALPDAEAFRCEILLWLASWHQVPAGSLPTDEASLARLSNYGRDLKAFRRARAAGALRSWILCADGRYHHPIIAEKVRAALAAKHRRRSQTAAATAARLAKASGATSAGDQQSAENAENGRDVTSDVTSHVTAHVADDMTSLVTFTKEREGKGREGKQDLVGGISDPPNGIVTKGGAAKTVQKGTRLPADWEPTAEDVEYAKKCGLNAALIAPRFRDYWTAKAGHSARKICWHATWRNWCRNTPGWVDPDGSRPPANVPPSKLLSRPMRAADGRELTETDLWGVST
jgi:hypothetical protein